MKIIHKDQTKIFKNSDTCTAIDYWTGDEDINGALLEITGRYPLKGRAVNSECKEMAYIIKGSGRIVVEGEETELGEGDLVLIDKGEKYFWEGNLIMLGSCTPAWNHEQYKEVE